MKPPYAAGCHVRQGNTRQSRVGETAEARDSMRMLETLDAKGSQTQSVSLGRGARANLRNVFAHDLAGPGISTVHVL